MMRRFIKENMSVMNKSKYVIGRAEKVDFPEGDVFDVPAKIDTGAFRTSVWATDVTESDGVLSFVLLGPESEQYSGKKISTKEYELVDVENSFGHIEQRYSIMFPIRLGGRRVRTNVTLSDRSMKTYPVLIGRKMLRGKFIVDVSKGDPLSDEEKSE